VKIRIGYGLGTRAPTEAGSFASLVDGLERLRFDSLWLSERLTGPCPDPMVGLAVAAGRTSRIKLGTSVQVLPGRNPVDVAKAWATLDRLAGGRALPAFGLGTPDPREHAAFGITRSERAARFDRDLAVIRRLWTGEATEGDVSLRVLPQQQPLDVWLGGHAPSELRRVGRLADGWLPSFCTPDDVARGREVIEATAEEHGRAIDPEHFGVLLPYVGDGGGGVVPDLVAAAVRARRPDVDPNEVIPTGLAGVRAAIERFLAVGASKFVLVPVGEPASWDDELGSVAEAVLPLQQ
jgi:probable F420-dependent oxidoreductase